MVDIDLFVIEDSTSEMLENFIVGTRNAWGEKVHEDYEVRVLPDVDETKINSFQFVDKEGSEPIHLVFCHKNGYYIAWGKQDKMIIFNDYKKWFKVQEDDDIDNDKLDRKTVKRNDKRRQKSKQPQPVAIITHRSSSGVEFHLSTAQECGLDSGYMCLESEGGDRHTIQVGQRALLHAFYAFRKPFAPGKDYKKNTSKAAMAIIHTFSESIKDDRIFQEVLRLHFSGGFLSRTLVEMENMWGHNSERAHSLLSCVGKIGKDGSIIEFNEEEQEFIGHMRIIMKKK
ncbi:hypothetical protein DCAR_0105174 [Daucus carota subsp. sativus]|uniref:Uncharacterized protein n=1 Tax=Daucus carota subsp. sativus TaxID=79200 RepID=A0AAF1AMV8_DAUCS|nr:PREDICTED: uncharacterized protein LOC108204711 [Daucus carota subsp. sativus]WOG85981.1 hypothetical protein DCAR_0105174 [Daucus carota subsp. sativus]